MSDSVGRLLNGLYRSLERKLLEETSDAPFHRGGS